MDALLKTSLRRSLWIHGGLIAVALLTSAFRHLLDRANPEQEITFIDLSAGIPDMPPGPPSVPEPAPEVKPQPKPVQPVITPAEPPKTVEKNTIKRSTNLVNRASVPPPKPVATAPKMSKAEIEKLLALGLPTSATGGGGGGGGSYSEMSIYYAGVKAAMYQAWDQPSGINSGLATLVKVRVYRDGAVGDRTLMRGSGNSVMDDSVMRAVRSVGRLKPLPRSVSDSYLDITITFDTQT